MNTKWSIARLGDVLQRVERFEPRDEIKEYPFAGTYSFARGIFVGERKLGSTFALSKIQRIREGDFVYCKIMAWEGAFGIVPREADRCVMSGAFVVYELDRDRIDPKFIEYFFKVPAHWKNIGSQSSGTNVRRQSLHPTQFEKAEIPLPPLAEQRRIVVRIEELASQIEKAKALRKQAAAAAEALIKSAVSNLCFRNAEMGCFGEYLIEAKNGIYKAPIYWGRGLPCLRMYNIDGPSLNQRNLQLLDVTEEELQSYGCVEGDLIFNRVNSAELVGKTGLVPAGFPRSTYESKNMRLRIDRSRAIPKFAAHILNSKPVRNYYLSVLKQQCGMATLNQGHVRNIPFPKLSVPEQRRIVAGVDALQAEVDKLRRLQAETAAELDAFLPSILDKAFKEEL